MHKIAQIFKTQKPVIGMVHLLALPGTPSYLGSFDKILEMALYEARMLKNCGVDGIMIENMNDVPYLKRHVGPEVVAAMAIVGREVKKESQLPTGIQILAGANKEALACAKTGDLDFIRAEGFIFSHIGDEGTFDAEAGELMRYRKNIGAENVAVFTDIKKKHSSHSITKDVDIVETAHAAEFFLSDGVIITGTATGKATSIAELESLQGRIHLPILIGSGLTEKNIKSYLHLADAFIVGSDFKQQGDWKNMLDEERIINFMKKVKR